MTAADARTDDVERYRRIRARWTFGGFGIGLLLGFVATGSYFPTSGWLIFPHRLIWNLIWAPILGAEMGFFLCPVRRKAPWSLSRFRLSTRTLMLVIAYLALLLGLGVSTERLGRKARHYNSRADFSTSMVKVLGDQLPKSQVEARAKLQNVPLLRAGRIPETLTEGQKEFLRSLDRSAEPGYRTYRYGLIAEGEEETGRRQERNVVVLGRLIKYYEALTIKYNRAQWRPWLPVAPDPPMPATE